MYTLEVISIERYSGSIVPSYFLSILVSVLFFIVSTMLLTLAGIIERPHSILTKDL